MAAVAVAAIGTSTVPADLTTPAEPPRVSVQQQAARAQTTPSTTGKPYAKEEPIHPDLERKLGGTATILDDQSPSSSVSGVASSRVVGGLRCSERLCAHIASTSVLMTCSGLTGMHRF